MNHIVRCFLERDLCKYGSDNVVPCSKPLQICTNQNNQATCSCRVGSTSGSNCQGKLFATRFNIIVLGYKLATRSITCDSQTKICTNGTDQFCQYWLANLDAGRCQEGQIN